MPRPEPNPGPKDYSLTAAVIAVATFTLAGIVLNAVAFRYPRFRPWLAGRARVVG